MPPYAEAPLDEFEGLTPLQMQQLFQDFLGPGSMVKLRDDLAAAVPELPLVHFIRTLLDRLSDDTLKLTAKGNLPAKLVKDFYATGRLPDYAIEHGFTKLRGEDDYGPAQVTRILADLLGWTKKRHGALSITRKGRQARELPAADFFRQVFMAHLRRFNLSWADGYPESSDVQHFFPYLAYLLLILGRRERAAADYADRMRRALPPLEKNFPGPLLEHTVVVRLFLRFLGYYGLVDVTTEPAPATVAVTERFHRVFYLDRDAQAVAPSEDDHYERQLRTALFDAETGAQSWVSDEMPLDDLEAFHAQIRGMEARREAGDTVQIRELLNESYIVEPSAISDGAGAEYAIAVLLQLLAGIRIQTERPDELEAFPYYAFLHDMLLEHEVVPPAPGQVLHLPFEEVFLAHYRPHERVTEWFLLGLFSPGDPFPQELLATEMRFRNRLVPRQRALDYIAEWQGRFREITAISYSPLEDEPPAAPNARQAVQLFHVIYEVVHASDGRRETFDGAGVVELLLEEEEWTVTGAQFPGFTL